MVPPKTVHPIIPGTVDVFVYMIKEPLKMSFWILKSEGSG